MGFFSSLALLSFQEAWSILICAAFAGILQTCSGLWINGPYKPLLTGLQRWIISLALWFPRFPCLERENLHFTLHFACCNCFFNWIKLKLVFQQLSLCLLLFWRWDSWSRDLHRSHHVLGNRLRERQREKAKFSHFLPLTPATSSGLSVDSPELTLSPSPPAAVDSPMQPDPARHTCSERQRRLSTNVCLCCGQKD